MPESKYKVEEETTAFDTSLPLRTGSFILRKRRSTAQSSRNRRTSVYWRQKQPLSRSGDTYSVVGLGNSPLNAQSSGGVTTSHMDDENDKTPEGNSESNKEQGTKCVQPETDNGKLISENQDEREHRFVPGVPSASKVFPIPSDAKAGQHLARIFEEGRFGSAREK